jgi:hypothetical protein
MAEKIGAYVVLIGEGTEVYRPVELERIGDGIFVVQEKYYDPDDEEWEFPPGSIVNLTKHILSDGSQILVCHRTP